MMRKQSNKFRVFYRSILRLILQELPQIKDFLFECQKKTQISKQIGKKNRNTKRMRATKKEYNAV